jgi:hypothetical protein
MRGAGGIQARETAAKHLAETCQRIDRRHRPGCFARHRSRALVLAMRSTSFAVNARTLLPRASSTRRAFGITPSTSMRRSVVAETPSCAATSATSLYPFLRSASKPRRRGFGWWPWRYPGKPIDRCFARTTTCPPHPQAQSGAAPERFRTQQLLCSLLDTIGSTVEREEIRHHVEQLGASWAREELARMTQACYLRLSSLMWDAVETADLDELAFLIGATCVYSSNWETHHAVRAVLENRALRQLVGRGGSAVAVSRRAERSLPYASRTGRRLRRARSRR